MLATLNRVIIFVGDVQKSAAFYESIFGFMPVPSDSPATEWVELDAGSCRLASHKAYGPDGPINAPTGSTLNPHKIVFYAPDVEAVRSSTLIQRGAAMGEVRRLGESLVLCDGQDPEGHVFQICNR